MPQIEGFEDVLGVVEDTQEEIINEENQDESSQEEISLARKQGWRPADEFKGPVGEFVTAHEFLERGAQWAHNLKRDVEGLKELSRNLVADNQRRLADERRQAEARIEELKNQVSELKALKAKAVENSDGVTVVKIDDQIEATREAIAEAKTAPQSSPQAQTVPDARVQATVENWKSQNPWYTADARAARYANMVGDEFMVSHPGAQLTDVLAYVEVETKKVFAQYGKIAPAGPDSGGSERSGGRTMGTQTRQAGAVKWEQLDEAGRKLGDEMIDRGVFKNRAEYLDFYMDGDNSTGNVGRTLTKYKKNRETK